MMRILSRGRMLILSTMILFAQSVEAQKSPRELEQIKARVLTDSKVKSVNVSAERGTPSLIIMNASHGAYTADQAGSALSSYLGVRAGMDNLVPQRSVALQRNMEVREFRQYYKGLRVEHARFTSMIKDGRVQFFNGAWFDVPAGLPTTPQLSEAQALAYAKNAVNASVYAWDEMSALIAKTNDAGIKARLQEELNEYLPKGELVIVKNFNNKTAAEMRLAYKFNIYAFQPLSRQWIYVDASNGQILLLDKIIKHADSETPGNPPASVATTVQTRYAGQRQIYVKKISGTDPNSGQTLVASNPLELGYSPGATTYVLIDDTRGDGIETYDLNGVGGLPVSVTISYSTAKSFTDMDNNWTLAEHKRGNTVPTQPVEGENDDIAWDAHWGAGVVYDYWKEKHNRLSFDGNNAKIKSYIHSGLAYDNAFWNGKNMTYGDGSYPAKSNGFKPLTSLDVCGHEIGHGICTFTSDLVYAMESGAMNEGLSDIWAACIEYYANKKMGTTYKPFYIGEQITSNPEVPLRRMDNPQARNNPDTYGGNRWTSQNCTPTLANDQCGVHNNSGVLNKWFYLLTVGSGAGSGPDAAYAGEDDGVNDLGNAYSITGVGFDLSEQIVYLTEMLLTSTATYAEAREVSIQVATDLSGSPCSNIVRSVTDAWYAVGVGAAFTEDCKITYGFTTQPGISVSESLAGSGCAGEYEVKVPVLMPANASGSVIVSGTATKDMDYRLPSLTIANTASTAKLVNLSVFIKNDAVVELDEAIDLTLSLTNVGSNTLNNKLRINIVEDDVFPVLGTQTKTALNADFNLASNGFTLPSGWSEIIGKEGSGPTGENLNHWGVWSGKLMVTGKLETGGTVLPAGTYNDASPTLAIAKSPQVDARGLTNLNLSFSFRVQGEVDPSGTEIEQWGLFDYMAVVYSFDGTTFFELTQQDGFGGFASLLPKDGKVQGTLPSFLNNKTFYLGFKWYNDTNAGGPESVSIDDVVITGAPRHIENEAGHHGSEQLGAGQTVYFYSVEDGELISSVNNNSTRSFGCTSAAIAKAGNGSFVMDFGISGQVNASEKVVKLTTEVSNKVSTSVTLYFTEEQLKALELATLTSRTGFAVYQVNAADLSMASSRNTTKLSATYQPVAGVGGSYSFAVANNLGESYYVLGYTSSTIVKGGGKNQKTSAAPLAEQPLSWKISAVYPNPAISSAFVNIDAPVSMKLSLEYIAINGQLISTQQESIGVGTNRVSLNLQPMSRGSYLIRFRDEQGKIVDTKPLVKQ